MQRSNTYETYQRGFEFEGLGSIPWSGVRGLGRGQNLTFSEYVHVAYQIKANRFAHKHTLYPGDGVKPYLFLKVVMLQSTMKANMLSLHTPLAPGGGGSKDETFFFFSEIGHVAYQIKVKEV